MRVRHRVIAAPIAQGDLEAAGVAFDRHGQELYDYCQSQLGDVADAAEVVEAAFVIAAAKASLLHNSARLRASLFALARHGCQQQLQAGAKPAYLDEISDSDWDRLGGTAWRSDLLSTAWVTLAEMSPRGREVAELSIRYGLDTADLADVLGVPRDHAHTLALSSGDRFVALWDLLLADCRGRSWYCETAAGYLSDLDGDLTRAEPGWMKEHTPRCAVCTKRERLNPGSAVVLGLLPTARLAADDRQRLLRLLSERSAEAEAYRAEVIERLGPFRPDDSPGRASPQAVRWRGTRVIAAGAAALAVVLLGAGAVLLDEHLGAQSGLRPTAGLHGAAPAPTQPGKTNVAAASPSPGKHSSSKSPTGGSPSPQQGNSPASSHSSQPSSPRPTRSHSSSSPPSPSPEPTTPSPTPTPTPSPTPSPSPTPDPTPTSSASLTTPATSLLRGLGLSGAAPTGRTLSRPGAPHCPLPGGRR
jgi:DNA-directed RNA polymerase specialized sigma24 family protein